MTNLTLKVDEDLLRRARIKALEQGTSVNAVLRARLEEYVVGSEAGAAVSDLLRRSDAFRGASPAGRRWTREDLYAERIDRIVDRRASA